MKKIGDVLVEAGLITAKKLEQGLAVSAKQNIRLGEALIDMGYISEDELLSALSKQFCIPRLGSEELLVDPTVLNDVSAQVARQYTLIPLHKKNGVLVVATSDPMNISILGDLEARLKHRIVLSLAGKDQILRAIERHYSGREGLEESINQVQQIENEKGLDLFEADDSMVQSAPVVKFVNQVFIGAIRERASDIHIERDGVNFHIRYRIDGLLKTMFRPKLHLNPLIVSRIKVMAKLDVSEHRVPQDGRIMMSIDGQSVDFRVAICPCIDGENVVIRILNRESKTPELPQLGFSELGLERLQKLLTHNFGLLIVAGQTGSGKTTTLYSILQQLNNEETKIITLEDPVEIRLPLLNQIQINPRVDLTFASGLRSILRMDPDIILVGEIRDQETAGLAVNAAMTGHLVFSTLHCGIASEVPVRLSEIGIEPYLTSNVLLGAIAQRLIRLNCPHCLEPETLSKEMTERFKPDFQSFGGKGCAACAGIGYRGRICIEEVLPIDDEIRKLMLERATNQQIEAEAITRGMVSLKTAGIDKIKSKLTSFAELARVL
ncbi:MAG: Flp pilus assembly complex ATPase component TadA [Candidatus Riflebacteria bacterium]|nr:Flp pilus assembly complex ATPase component TadA [Candidatus Riflebacteria bacterium]